MVKFTIAASLSLVQLVLLARSAAGLPTHSVQGLGARAANALSGDLGPQTQDKLGISHMKKRTFMSAIEDLAVSSMDKHLKALDKMDQRGQNLRKALDTTANGKTGSASGSGPGGAPGSASGGGSGSAPGNAPGSAPGSGSERGSESGSGSGSGSAPGSESGSAPAGRRDLRYSFGRRTIGAEKWGRRKRNF